MSDGVTIEVVIAEVAGLARADLERWVALEWVRPERAGGGWLFHGIDIARVRLIHELAAGLRVDEEAMPVVLSLLDQLYDARRRMRALAEAIAAAPEEPRRAVLERIAATQDPPNQL